MRKLLVLLLVFSMTSLVHAEETLRSFSWSELKAKGQLLQGEVVVVDTTKGAVQTGRDDTDRRERSSA